MFRWCQIPMIAAFCAAVFFWNLGAIGLWDRDEPRNAGCAAEMLAADNWIVPVFNDQLRHLKPVMTYWLMMTSYQVFGVNEFAARFWSALLGTGTALLAWRIGWRLFDNRTGMLAALILPGTVMFTLASRAATPDSPLIFCFTLAMLVFVETARRGQQFRENGTAFWRMPVAAAVGLYTVIGLGALTKGLAGVVPPLAVIGLFLMLRQAATATPDLPDDREKASRFRRSARHFWRVVKPANFFGALISMRPVLGAVVVLIVAGPWFIAVGKATEGEFLSLFFYREHLVRATQPMEGHSGGLWFYPVALLAGFFPWSVFAVPVLVDRFRQRDVSERVGSELLLVWIGVVVGLFSLASTKLPSYVTPCYPALAILFARSMVRFADATSLATDRLYRWGLATAAVCAVAVAGGLAWLSGQYLPGRWELVWIALPILAASAACLWMMGVGQRGPENVAAVKRRKGVPLVFAAGAGLFSAGLFGFGSQVVDSTRQTGRLLAAVRSETGASHVSTYRCLESSWVYYSGRPMIELTEPGEQGGHWSSKQRFWDRLPQLSPADFAQQFPGSVILTTDEHWPELQSQLNGAGRIVMQVPDFLHDRQLMLISLKDRQATAAVASRNSSVPASPESRPRE